MQALDHFVLSAGFFLLLRALRPGLLNWVFALATAIAIPLFIPTFEPENPVLGTFVLPNWGACRYVWVGVGLAVPIWERFTDEPSRRRVLVLATGCFAWVQRVLWSAESAFFCSGAWLPAHASNVLRVTAGGPIRWRRIVAWLALTGVMLAAGLGIVVVAYLSQLGHLLNWASSLDYAREVGLNLLVMVQEPVGPAMGLLLGFCLLAIGAYSAGFRQGLHTRDFALWVGLLGASWTTNTYGCQRALVNFHLVAYATLGVLLVTASLQPQSSPWNALTYAGTGPSW